MTNPNILSLRYATPEINGIFSDQGKILAERDLWIAVMEAQRDLGVDIPQDVIDSYKAARDNIDLERIKEIERETRHDIKAKIQAFVEVAGTEEHIHRGMTSRDLTDNVEQMQIKQASEIIFGKYVSVLRHMIDRANEYNIPITARTHHQAAQPTTLGRRFAMWGEELLIHLTNFEGFIETYPLRGIKGPVGTQADMLTLLGDSGKVAELEGRVVEQLGFNHVLDAPGQVYARSLDYAVVSHLSKLTSACESFGKTMRLMAGYDLVTEGFKPGQVGSSAMPHKMNTRTSERVVGFSYIIKGLEDTVSRIAGDQWEEGDVSCSVVRRFALPNAIYASDGLCESALTVLNEMGCYPAVIEAEIEMYLPFLATTEILTVATQHGLGREEAHEIIRKHAVAEAVRMREEGKEPNLVELLAEDPSFKQAGIGRDEINDVLQGLKSSVGNANEQIFRVAERAQALFDRYPEQAQYEPGEIL